MEIKQIITHSLDTFSNLFVASEIAYEPNEDAMPFIESKIRKILHSQNRKEAYFQRSIVEDTILKYRVQEMDFVNASSTIAKHIFEEKRKYNVFTNSLFIFCEVLDEDTRYLIGMDNSSVQGLTHITNAQETVYNEIKVEKNLFSANILKNDRIFIFDTTNSELMLIENPYVTETQSIYLFEHILGCKANPSFKESVQVMNECAQVIANKYAMDEIEIMPKLKNALKESVDEKAIVLEEVASSVFTANAPAQQDFKEEVKKAGIKENFAVENVRIAKSDKTEKIRTDQGIEISIPVEYMESHEYFEIIHEPSGSISIQLKNITTLERK